MRAARGGGLGYHNVLNPQPNPASPNLMPPVQDSAAPAVATEITLHRASRAVEVAFSDGRRFRLPCEFLRVYSPSAEVRGHGPGQEVLQTGKREVTVAAIEPVGHYAVRLRFSDGHDTGIYTWDLLYAYGLEQEAMWQRYLERLAAAGAGRDPVRAP